MELYLIKAFNAERGKRPKTHMQSYASDFNASRCESVKCLWSEVEACGWGRYGALFFLIDGLVTLAIFCCVVAVNVRR